MTGALEKNYVGTRKAQSPPVPTAMAETNPKEGLLFLAKALGKAHLGRNLRTLWMFKMGGNFQYSKGKH